MTQDQLEELLADLSLDEKIGQLVQLSGDFFTDDPALSVGPQQKLGIDSKTVDLVGSVLNVAGAEKTRQIQKSHLEKSKHKIPLLFMADIVYGCRTVFPIPLGFASSWNPRLVHDCYEVSSDEARSMGIHVTFAPMLDLVRDARWGRCLESTGEDPWLQSRYAEAMVSGFQGSNLSHRGIASCIKHFAGYGASEAGRDYNTVDMSERHLREMYLPPYKAAVDAGCAAVMPSFNTVDDVPSTASTWLLRDVLRDEWGFDGLVVTDYAAIHELVEHGVAADDTDAARLAINAGVDVDMKTACYANGLSELVESGVIDEKLIDEACMRVLKLKNDLGLFEDPYRDVSVEAEAAICLSDHNRELVRHLAEQSMLLLKNQGKVLPLDPEKSGRIALIGPYAKSRAILGLWAVHGSMDDVVTLDEALREIAGDDVMTVEGCPLVEDESAFGFFGYGGGSDSKFTEEKLASMRVEAVEAAAQSDVIVLAIGEHPMESGEGGSKTDLRLPAVQRALLDELKKLGKPIITVVFSGRTPVLTDIVDSSDALIEAWFPGTEGTKAIADIIFGKVNPSARTAMSFPYANGQSPIYYNAFNTGRPERTSTHTNRFTSRYLDCQTAPLFPFGFGLSYHSCEYRNLALSSDKLDSSGSIEVSIDVENVSDVAGDEVVQLYIRDLVGSVVRPVKELKGFEKVHLEAHEKTTVRFSIDESMLRFWRKDMTFGSEPGMFDVMVGRNSEDVSSARFELL